MIIYKETYPNGHADDCRRPDVISGDILLTEVTN